MKEFLISISIAIFILGSQTSDLYGQWTPINGPYKGGQVYKFDTKDSLLFACTNAGLYTSIKGSSIWNRNDNGLPAKPILDIEFNGQSWFVATMGSAIVCSNDNGITWLNASTGITDSTVKILRAVGTKLFAGTQNSGLFVSNNLGSSWTKVNAINGIDITDIETVGNLIMVSSSGFGVYVSSDSGLTWTLSTTGMTNLYITSLAVDSTRVLATTNGGYLFISFDSCNSWSISYAVSSATCAYILGADMYVCPVGGVVKKSSDNGITWASIPIGLLSPYSPINDLLFTDSVFYAGTWNSGVYKSYDGGNTWVNDDSGMKGRITTIAATGAFLYAGTYGDGLYMSFDSGNSWSKSNNGLPTSTIIYSVKILGGKLFAATLEGLYTSMTYGLSWSHVSGLTGGGAVKVVEFIGNRIYTGHAGPPNVRYSTDNGLTWNITNAVTDMGCLSIAGMQNYLIAGAIGFPYATYSNNNGLLWNSIPGPILSSSIGGVGFTSNFVLAGGSTIWRSDHTGSNWNQSSTGLPSNTGAYCMRVQGSSTVLIGSWNGIYKSVNQGDTWFDFNNGFDYRNVYDIYDDFGKLYIATYRGIWHLPMITHSDSEPSWQEASDLKLFPNPSNSTVKIKWNEKADFNHLVITNTLGQMILAMDIRSKQEETVSVDQYPAGIYYLIFSNQKYSVAEKLIVY